MGLKIEIGKLYQISIVKEWNHAILDLNPNDCMSSPINILRPGDMFLVLDVDYWDVQDAKVYDAYLCLYILYEEMTGWILVGPNDIVPMLLTP